MGNTGSCVATKEKYYDPVEVRFSVRDDSSVKVELDVIDFMKRISRLKKERGLPLECDMTPLQDPINTRDDDRVVFMMNEVEKIGNRVKVSFLATKTLDEVIQERNVPIAPAIE